MSRVAAARRDLAVVDRRLASVGEADHHEAAAAEVARLRVRHRQREADGDRCVDRVAAAAAGSRSPRSLACRSVDPTMPCRARTGSRDAPRARDHRRDDADDDEANTTAGSVRNDG